MTVLLRTAPAEPLAPSWRLRRLKLGPRAWLKGEHAMDLLRRRIGLAAGVLVLGIVSAAGADGGRGGGFVPGAPQPNLDPGAAIAQGLLQRDFLYMRATSPNPSRFPTPLFALPPAGTSYRYPPSYPYYGGGYYPYGGGGYYPYNYGYGYPGFSTYGNYS